MVSHTIQPMRQRTAKQTGCNDLSVHPPLAIWHLPPFFLLTSSAWECLERVQLVTNMKGLPEPL